jgi:hypothetical protein
VQRRSSPDSWLSARPPGRSDEHDQQVLAGFAERPEALLIAVVPQVDVQAHGGQVRAVQRAHRVVELEADGPARGGVLGDPVQRIG